VIGLGVFMHLLPIAPFVPLGLIWTIWNYLEASEQFEQFEQLQPILCGRSQCDTSGVPVWFHGRTVGTLGPNWPSKFRPWKKGLGIIWNVDPLVKSKLRRFCIAIHRSGWLISIFNCISIIVHSKWMIILIELLSSMFFCDFTLCLRYLQ
jgi:hypothetical protein